MSTQAARILEPEEQPSPKKRVASNSKMRSIRRCLNSNCKHVFIVDAGNFMARCPDCKNAPTGSVKKGDVSSWPLKEAKEIAATLRGT